MDVNNYGNPPKKGTYYVEYHKANKLHGHPSAIVVQETAYWTGKKWITFDPDRADDFRDIVTKRGAYYSEGEVRYYPPYHRPVNCVGVIGWRTII